MKKKEIGEPSYQVRLGYRRTRQEGEIIIPTDDRRHMPKIRFGKMPGDAFAKKKVMQIPVDDDSFSPRRENAKKEIQSVGQKGSKTDEKDVRGQEGKTSVLRDSQQKRKRQKPSGQSEQRVQKASQAKMRKKPVDDE